jgi:hypothetical protein
MIFCRFVQLDQSAIFAKLFWIWSLTILLFFKKGSLDILVNQYDQILSIWPLVKLVIIFYNIMYPTYHMLHLE